jgi:hypothetical protein
MLIYLIVPALALLPTLVSRSLKTPDASAETSRPERWRYAYVLSTLALIVFAGARLNVGTDYSLYQTTFYQLDPHYLGYWVANSPQEPGFTVGVLILKMIVNNPRILFLVSSLVTVGCAAIAMRRLSTNFAMSLTLYVLLGFYLAPFNILRQGLAVSLTFLAYSYFERHKGRWLVLNVLAALMHSSAIIAVVLQLAVRRSKPSVRLLVIMLGATAVFALYFATVASDLGFLGFLNERYVGYLSGHQSGIGTYLYLVSRVLLVALLLRYRPRNGEIDHYIVLSMVGVCLLLLGTQAEAIGRLELYFGIYLTVALPQAIQEIPRRGRLLVVSVVVIGSLGFYIAYLGHFGNLVPYHFDWSLVGLRGEG